MAADFEVKKDSKNEWYWTLQADNNKTIARSSESYVTRNACLHSIRLVKELAPGCPVYDMTTSPIHRVTDLP
ncbi:MAG: DUF1508 domain-containing protein [Acidobacteriota bacterium]|nr:DUF1508 domain-containing protein [Acidobacteriota bacterium]